MDRVTFDACLIDADCVGLIYQVIASLNSSRDECIYVHVSDGVSDELDRRIICGIVSPQDR